MKVHPILFAILETTRSVFIQMFYHCSVSWKITPLCYFSWNFIWFGQKKPTKMQNFKLLTVRVKFYQISTLIGFFRWKYIKFQLIKYRGVVSHDTKEWGQKTNLLFQKWQEFGKLWSEHWIVSNICTLIGPFCAKYITFDLKNDREVIFDDTEESCKIWRKTNMWFQKWHEEFGKFSPEHLKVSTFVLWWDPFV